MSWSTPACPSCHSEAISFNGHTRHGKQNYKCRDCGRQFVLNPQWHPLTQEQRDLIDRLLLERISLADIARVMQRSDDCIQAMSTRKPTPSPLKSRSPTSQKSAKRFKWLNCGPFSITKEMSNGFG